MKSFLMKKNKCKERLEEEKNVDTVANSIAKYGVLMSYFQYENNVYWARSSFVMLSQAALFGFSTSLFPTEEVASRNQILLLFLLSLFGLVLCKIWLIMIDSAIFWISRWASILKKLELPAFGDVEILRGIEDLEKGNAKVHSVRKTSEWIRRVFVVIWCIFIVYGYFQLAGHYGFVSKIYLS